MTRIAILLTCIFVLFACKTQEVIQNSMRTDSVYIQRLIPIALPADTGKVKALLECNAQGRVIANRLEIETTRNMRLSFLLDSLGNLRVQSITEYDTIYLPSDSVFVNREVVVTRFEEVPAKLSKWQGFYLNFGNVAFWIIVGAVVLGIILLIVKLKK